MLEAGGHQRAEAVLPIAKNKHVFDSWEVLYESGYFLGMTGHAGRGKTIGQHTARS